MSDSERAQINETEEVANSSNQKIAAKLSSSPSPMGDYIRKGVNGSLIFAVIAGAVGSSFQHGYNTGVTNAPQTVIENWIEGILNSTSPGENNQSQVTMIYSVAVSIFCVGGMMGGMSTGYVAETFGRKGGLLLNNSFVFVAALLFGCAKMFGSYYMLILGRFIIGINSGLNAGLAPMYLAEIPPINLRGAVGTVYQLVITISILVSQLLGLGSLLGNAEYWPILFTIILVPAILQLVTLPFCPESPKYLANTGKEREAERALVWLRGTIEVHDEMDDMKSEYEAQRLTQKVKLSDMVTNRMLRIPLTIAVMVMIAQQLSGINAVIFYSTEIFKMADLTDSQAQTATLSMGAMNVLMTCISLVLVEQAGRKTLLMAGFSGMFVTTLLLGIFLQLTEVSIFASKISIGLVIIFVIFFAVGPGSIPWFLVSELFNQSARPTAISIAVAVNWGANFFVGLGFLPLKMWIGSYVFVLFAILQVFFLLFIFKRVPETKNKTVEEISAMFRQISYK